MWYGSPQWQIDALWRFQIPPEMMGQMRFGRGLDNRKLMATGFKFRFTTRETVMKFSEHLRLRSVLRGVREPYRYEKEVEDFLRWSPSVRDRALADRPPRYFPPAPAAEAASAVEEPAPQRR